MNYSELYFGKNDISQLTIIDIEEFFKTEKDESDKIEYKSFVANEKNHGSNEAKEKGVLRTICGFLNSEGGILIWGAPKGQKIEDKRGKVFKGELSMVDQHFEKDELIAKITNRITPAPKGIKLCSFEKGDKYVYVFEVPKSEYAPHQFENVYYMRLDGQTLAAPHHYIDALFKKIRFPNIEGYIELKSLEKNEQFYYLKFNSYFFNQSPFQNEYKLSYRIFCTCGTFQGWQQHTQTPNFSYANQGHNLRVNGAKEVLHFGEPLEVSNTLVFDPEELREDQNKASLLLSFSGNLSPMKFSEYQLQIGLGRTNDIDECMISRNENIFSHERRTQSGLSDYDVVKKIIGRK